MTQATPIYMGIATPRERLKRYLVAQKRHTQDARPEDEVELLECYSATSALEDLARILGPGRESRRELLEVAAQFMAACPVPQNIDVAITMAERLIAAVDTRAARPPKRPKAIDTGSAVYVDHDPRVPQG